jgi:AcrR family transcriptional regulator
MTARGNPAAPSSPATPASPSASTAPATPPRDGARRDAILDAALELLVAEGYAGTSMQKVARAAGASKETLYAWFGDKAGLFEALVAREAAAMNATLDAALARESEGAEPRVVLERFGRQVLALLFGARSISINRAAIAAAVAHPELGRVLAAGGRESSGARVVAYLAAQHAAGRLDVPDPRAAFERLMGLLLGDVQVRVLMGAVDPPGESARRTRAKRAVDAFLLLHGPADG